MKRFLSRLRRIPHRWALLSSLVIVVVLIVIWPSPARADVQQVIFSDILSPIVTAMIRLFALLTAYIVGLLILVAQQNNFINSAPVVTGYPIVRDLANMIFIIALLIIAAGTILRLENYRYNRLLGRLIVMAFLVNLARFITGFFIQTSQVFMLTFVNAFKDIALGNFANMFGLDVVLKFSQQNPTATDASLFMTLVGGLAMMIIAFCVILAVVVILIVRIVALWILTILSPLAYALRIIPNTERYASQWWSEFGKYVVSGPVLAFFLWLALALSAGSANQSSVLFQSVNGTSGANANLTNQVQQQLAPIQKDFVTEIFSMPRLMTFIVSIIFLMMGMQYASKSGGAGAGFAKRIYEKGLGVGATATGLNAIRSQINERAVAPVQGWIKNRQAARQGRIQERTAALESAGARIRSQAPVMPGILGREGRERAAASAQNIEGQRTQQFIQSRGLQNLPHDDVMTRFLTTTGREQLAAMTVLKDRGRINLQDPNQEKAFNQAMAWNRVPEGDRLKMREEIFRSNMGGMDENSIRARLGASTDPEQRIQFAQELQRRQLLKVGRAEDEQISAGLLNDLAANPERLQAARESMMKTNPDMAKKVIFGSLADSSSRRAFLSAIQQKQMNPSALNHAVQDTFARAGEAAAIGNFLNQISPDAETLNSYRRQMDPEAAQEIFSHLTIADDASAEERQKVARVTGEWGKAFTQSNGTFLTAKNSDGTSKKNSDGSDVTLAQEFASKLGGEEISKNISLQALKDQNVLQSLRRSDNMKASHWEALRKRNKETRAALEEGLKGYADHLGAEAYDKQGNIILDLEKLGGNEDRFKENEFVVRNLMLASKGKENRYNLADEKARQAFERLVSGASAADLSDITKSPVYAAHTDTVNLLFGWKGKMNEVAEMLTENYQFAVDAMKETEKTLTEKIKAGGREGSIAYNRLKEMSKHPILSNYIAYPEKPSEGGGKGGTAAAAAAGVAAGVAGMAAAGGMGGSSQPGPESSGPSGSTPPPPNGPSGGGAGRAGRRPSGGGSGQAYRQAQRAQPPSPGSPIVVPSDADFPSDEERSRDPRIERLSPKQKELRNKVVQLRDVVAGDNALTSDDRRNLREAFETILSERDQARFQALIQYANKGGKLSATEKKQFEDLLVTLGAADTTYQQPGAARSRSSNLGASTPSEKRTIRDAEAEIIEEPPSPPQQPKENS